MSTLIIIVPALLLVNSFCLLFSGAHQDRSFIMYLLRPAKSERRNKQFIESKVITGSACLVFTIAFFFATDKNHFHSGTVEQALPVLLPAIHLLITLFLILNILAGPITANSTFRKA